MRRVLLGVGNRFSADDGVGPMVAERLEGAPGWLAIDCGIALENASGIVTRERPGLLVIVDAARMGLVPGSIRRLPTSSPDRMLASTHGLPLTFILDRLGDAAGEVALIGIEPRDVTFGAEMSEVVSIAADELVSILREEELSQIERLGEEPR